ncbi:MAG: biotin--[acetyl-CoA-carboxylase] ligase [Leptolyngbya sp. SIOISBB]|nr:biotin--[acetyl-CoA-carboxylase] ligase [Leptolyngbya sp. SIOISBB]
MIDYQRLITALVRPSSELGILPELAALRPDFQLHLYDRLPSTNQTAWQLIDQGHGAGTVVIAAEQTAGRGQWGRTWASPPGGLYLSLVLEPEMPLRHSNLLTLTSAWGIATSLLNLAIPIQIKWPNDLVSQGSKVGGILTESRLATSTTARASPQLQQVVIGVGLNWDNPLPTNAASIRQLLPDEASTRIKTLEDLAAIALRGILQGFYYWQQQGNSAFVNAYIQKLAHHGKKVKLDGHIARVEGVTLQGDLIVSLQHNGQKFVRFLKPGEISLGYNG